MEMKMFSGFINGVRETLSFIGEEHRLNSKLNEAEDRFREMLSRFGGVSGQEVTFAQIEEYMVTDLKWLEAFTNYYRFRHPKFESPNILLVQNAQNLQTPEGRKAAVLRIEEELGINGIRQRVGIGDAVDSGRLDVACRAAIDLLAT